LEEYVPNINKNKNQKAGAAERLSENKKIDHCAEYKNYGRCRILRL
jgi:hypothetical protein